MGVGCVCVGCEGPRIGGTFHNLRLPQQTISPSFLSVPHTQKKFWERVVVREHERGKERKKKCGGEVMGDGLLEVLSCA